MSRTKIIVPRGIRFISDWKDYQEKYLYDYPHILDKQIPGCGYTEWCIRSKGLNVILCSPRRILLQNKTDQHQGEVLYAKNDLEVTLEVDKDLNAKPVQVIDNNVVEDKTKIQQQYISLKNKIETWWFNCITTGKPCKILVTYDSYYLVKDILEKKGIFDKFQTVVDEFQSIFVDAVFKSDTEMKFMDALRGVNRVVYVSATPMMSKYLQMIPEFSNLPAYELDWETDEPGRVSKPNLDIKRTRSIVGSIKPVIKKYKEGNFPFILVNENGLVGKKFSKELVIYVNSVKNIISIIKHGNLLPEETNILCADTIENGKRIKEKLGNNWNIGRVLTQEDLDKGQKQKMFTLCTRTVYLGADFYSDNAKSYILSDSNVNCLAVDISLDLPQILGRQRLDNNPWKNSATFYYMLPGKKTIDNAKLLKLKIADKLDVTKDLLVSYNSTPEKSQNNLGKTYEKLSKSFNYKDDYIAVTRIEKTDSRGNKIITYLPKENNLVHISDERAYEIQRIDYRNRFSVFNSAMSSIGKTTNDMAKDKIIVENFKEQLMNQESTKEKLKFLCTSDLTNDQLNLLLENYISGTAICKHYREIGPELLKKYNYDTSRIKKSVLPYDNPDIKNIIEGHFIIGNKYSVSEIKNYLDKLYKDNGYSKPAKSNDIVKYFEIEETRMFIDSKKVRGYKILKKLP